MKREIRGSPNCFKCGREEGFKKHSLFVQMQDLKRLKFKCVFSSFGCSYFCAYENLGQHQMNCAKQQRRCPSCNFQFMGNLMKHLHCFGSLKQLLLLQETQQQKYPQMQGGSGQLVEWVPKVANFGSQQFGCPEGLSQGGQLMYNYNVSPQQYRQPQNMYY